MGTEVAAGRAKLYELAQTLRAVVTLEQLRLAEQAEQRAAELHELKLADLRSQVKAAVEDKTAGGTQTLTREDVYDLVDQVMRGAA
jgi:hypothetical protein